MAQSADGSRRYLAFVKETTFGVTPANPNLQAIRVTGGDSINNARSNITSDEIRNDRQIIVSRLGQNQPELSVPFELSFESFETLFEGALGNEWVGNYSLAVNVDAANAVLTNSDSNNWADLGVKLNDWVLVTNLETSADNGIYYVSSVATTALTLQEPDQSTAASFTTANADAINLIGGFTGGQIDASTINLSVSASANTITAASDAGWHTTYRLSEGDSIYFQGFTNATNNGWHLITSISDTVITLGESSLTTETVSSGEVDFMVNSAILRTGVNIPTFTLEEGFVDVSEYHQTLGAKITSMAISMQPDSIITGSFDFTGQIYTPFSDNWQTTGTAGTGASIGTLVQGNTNQVFDSYTGSLVFAGEDLANSQNILITGIDFTLDNGVDRRFAILDRNAKSLSQGRITCTGTVSAFFPDATLAAKFDTEEIFEIRVRLEDLEGNSYLFGWPNAKFTSETKSVSETDVTESLDITMLGGDDYYNTFYIKKQPDTPARV